MVTHQTIPDDRLLRALAEQLKLPLIQIARQSEPGSWEDSYRSVTQTAEMALSLIDGFLLSTDMYAQQMLELEPVAVSSVLYAASQDLKDHARQYNCDIDLSLSGKYTPVMGSFNALRLAFTALGSAFIDAQPSDNAHKRIVLAAHGSSKGIVAGIFGSQPGLSSDMYKRAKALYGVSKQPLASTFSNASAGVFVADSLFSSIATPLKVSSHNKLSGLATTLLPSKQMQLGMKILLVEPDYVLSDAYSRSLKKAGHNVVIKSSAQGAVDAMNSENLDLIVIEIQMAGHNGLEFLHELRSYSEWQKVPIIILTLVPRNSFQVEENQFKNLGVKSYLYKPVTTNEDLIAAIDRLSTEKYEQS